MDPHREIAAVAMVVAWRFDSHSARDYPAEAALEIIDTLLNVRAQRFAHLGALKIDLDRDFHDNPSLSRASRARVERHGS